MFAYFRRWIPRAALAASVFFLLATLDLALRSRDALKQAQRHEEWISAPRKKSDYYAARYSSEIITLKRQGLSAEEMARRTEILSAQRDFLISESSAKMSYIWYQSAAHDFYFPLNPWAARAKARLPAALSAWQAEIDSHGIKAPPWITQR